MQTKSSSSDISSASKLTARLSANSHASRDFDEWCLRQFPELLLGANVLIWVVEPESRFRYLLHYSRLRVSFMGLIYPVKALIY